MANFHDNNQHGNAQSHKKKRTQASIVGLPECALFLQFCSSSVNLLPWYYNKIRRFGDRQSRILVIIPLTCYAVNRKGLRVMIPSPCTTTQVWPQSGC